MGAHSFASSALSTHISPTKAALASLPRDWQNWIAENLARACDPFEMAKIMARDGHYDEALIEAALEQASDGKVRLAPRIQSVPDIDTSSNTLRTSDRVIDVLMTLTAPRIVLLGNVLSGEECNALTTYCEPRLERSPVVDSADGSMQTHAKRTSRGAMLQRAETALIGTIEARLSEIARWPIERGEGLQVQRYGTSDEYRPHFDWFDAQLPGPRKHMEHGGQRLATFVLYLSDVESGGGTAFPTLGLEVLPKKGAAIFFQNTNGLLQPDHRTLHAGCPVVRGVKYIANKWLRADTY